MSRTVAAAVIERRFGSVTRKAVAATLAEHASITDDGEWWTIVGQRRIAAEAEVSDRTVRSVLADFESEGLIKRVRRHRKDGSRTSDRTLLNESAIRSLPEAVSAGLPEAGSAPTGSSPSTLPETGADPTGKAIAAHEPSEEPSEEPAAAAELPAIRWARRWAEVRQVPFTTTVRRSWASQVQELLAAGGCVSEGLLAQALREGIREPKGWAYVAAGARDAGELARVNEKFR